MTTAQIMAVLSLLLAFGVSPQEVSHVKQILEAPKANSVIIQTMTTEIPKEEEVVEPAQPKKSKYAQENVPVITTYTTSPKQ